MAVFEIPLSPSENQKLSVTLAGVGYQMTVIWRGPTGWVLDLADADGAPLVLGMAMVPGADLMAQHPEIGFPGQLWVQSDYDTDAPPTFDDLGNGSHLYFIG